MNFFKAVTLTLFLFFSAKQWSFAQPTISSFMPASGVVGTIVTITGTNLNNPTALNIGGVAAIPISNTGTSLVAMVMPGAITGTLSITTAGGTTNASANFTITTVGIPTTRSGSKLMPIITNDSSSEMGEFVAMSADGKTAAIGGRFNSVGGVFARGPIVVFANNNGVWAQQGGALYGSDGLTGCGSLSLSADGNTLLVGGYTSAPGGAYIFTRTNGVWSQQGSKLVGAGAIGNSQQGYSVSLSADGNTAAICGFKDNNVEGGVYIFTRTNGVWTQQGNKLVGTGSTGNVSQGEAIHLSADGNTLLVAGLEDDDFKGAVWVFIRSGGVWSQQGNKLVGTGTARADYFGWALSSSADGNTAMVGSDSKGAWVFTRSTLGIWSLQTKLTTPAAASGFGSALSLSADGNTAIVGDPYGNSTEGAVYIFKRSGNSWSQQGGKLSGSGYSQSTWSRFLSLSADGSTFISGSKANAGDLSAAWIFNYTEPAPTITNFSPQTGKPGDVVTITGTNFNTTAANNIVFFGATKASVTAASATSLTVTVPSGATYAPITLLNTGINLAAFSAKQFTPTYNPAKTGFTATDFSLAQNFSTATGAYSVAIGDLDGDSKPDLAVASNASNTVSVFRNTANDGSIGAGSFATRIDFTTGAAPSSLAIGDLDGDGKLDLVVGNYNASNVSVFHNTATNGSINTGSFAARVNFATEDRPASIAIGDVDGDGKPDLAVGHFGVNVVSVLRNTSSIGSIGLSSFAAKVDFATGSRPTAVAIGDLDGDGKPDLAAANKASNTVSVFRNTATTGSIGAGSFAAKVDFATGSEPVSIAIGDLDGDGKADLAVANSVSNNVSILHNTASSGSIGLSSFATKVDFATGIGTNPIYVAIGDLSGDGKPDLVVVNASSNGFSVFRNTASSSSIGLGSFAAKVDFSTGNLPTSVAIGDLDGDGKPDVAVTNSNTLQNTLSVLRNADIIFPPTISNFTATSGSVGSLVTITGTNLNNPTAISIGGVAAIPISNTGTSLVAMVMPGATTGTVSVTTAGGTANGTGNYTSNAKTFPNSQQGAKLVGTGATGTGSEQGKSVSISADGYTAVVSGYADDGLKGAVWVYTRTGGNWTQQGTKLTATGAVGNAGFGTSVSLSADGNTILIGGTFDNNNLGAVWVFTRTGGVWSQQGNKLVGTGSSGTTVFQGGSVSLSADGNTAISGGYGDNNNQGAVWVFKRVGTSWAQQGNKLVGTGVGSFPRIGYSVGLSADGNTIITGGYSDNNQGAVWVFTQTAGVWSQQGNKLTATGNTGNASLGISVAINADGNTAVVGGYSDDGNKGAVWIFTRTAGIWSQQTKLSGNDKVGNAIEGLSVTISADGNTVVTGGSVDNANTGASWVYGRTAGVWTQRGNKLVGSGNIGVNPQGASLAISADGNTLMVGGKSDNSAGAAWVFVNIAEPKTSLTSINACSNYLWNTVTYSASGVYTKTFPGGSSIGTDSIATLKLTINQPSTSTTTASARNEFTWNTVLYKKSGTYTRTFAGANSKGCDSIATLNITIVDTSATTITNCGNYTWNGTTYNNSGTYTRTFTGGSAQGNDSIATLNLTINQPSTSNTTASARNGFTWNTVLYKKSGTYTRTFTGGNAKGCDSVATLNITIVDTSATTIINCGNYTWNGTTYTTSGTYTRTFTGGSAQGNDSIATLNLIINRPTSSSVTLSACDSLLWNGTMYKTSGVYTKILIGANSNGCDSVVTLNLTVNNSTSSTTTVNISTGGSYLFNNITYRVAGNYQARLQNSRGCDSIANLVLTTNNVIFNSTIVNNPCINSTVGNISVSATGGFGALTYSLNNGAYQASTVFSNLGSGAYTVNVRDAQGIIVSKVETIVSLSNTPIVPVLTAQNISCFGGNNGAVTISSITGGVAPYTTLWTPSNSTANTINNLTIGNYSARVTDAFGCSVTVQQTVTQPALLVVSAVTTNPLCNNQCNGSIQASSVGGTGAVSYTWSNNASTSLISNLCAGSYTVTATDANGCTATRVNTVVNPPLFSLNLDSVYTICANQNYKTDITNTGFANSVYSWTSSVGFTAATPTVTLTTPGLYYARAVSPNGCIALDTLNLRASRDSIKSEFQVATNVFVNDTVKFVNINEPFPDSSIWSLPTGTTYNVVSRQPVLLELRFNQAGQYTVGLRTKRGACQSVSSKTISVLQPTGIPNTGSPVLSYFIERFGISPNPNRGVFTVNIKLSQPSAIRLRLVNTITGVVISNLPFASSNSFTIPYNLTLGNGSYVMILETSFAPGFFQMIVQ